MKTIRTAHPAPALPRATPLAAALATCLVLAACGGGGEDAPPAAAAPAPTPVGVEQPSAPAATPRQPAGLRATLVAPSTVRLDWTDVADNESGYEVGLVGPSGFDTVGAAPAGATSFLVTALAGGDGTQFGVRAVNAAGVSPVSTVALDVPSPSLAPPAAPSLLAMQPFTANDGIVLSWRDNALDESSYELRLTRPDGSVLARSLPADSTRVSLGDLAPGTYGAELRARKTVLALPVDSTPVRASLTLVVPPAAPTLTGIAAAGDGLSVRVQWTAGANDATGFELAVSANGVARPLKTLAADARSVTFASAPGDFITVQLRALRATPGGTALKSAPALASVQVASAETVTTLVATADNRVRFSDPDNPADGIEADRVLAGGDFGAGCSWSAMPDPVGGILLGNVCQIGLLQFTLPASLAGRTITSAQLVLNSRDSIFTLPRTLEVRAMGAPWDPATITYRRWLTLPVSTQSFTMATPPAEGPVNVDITGFVQAWVKGPAGGGFANNGLSIFLADASHPGTALDLAAASFVAHDDTNATLRPRLIVHSR